MSSRATDLVQAHILLLLHLEQRNEGLSVDTFALGAIHGTLGVRLSVTRAVNAVVLTRQWLVAVPGTRYTSLLGAAVKLPRNTVLYNTIFILFIVLYIIFTDVW